MFCEKGILRNFAKFTGKHLRQSLFLNHIGGLTPQICNFFKKRDSRAGISLINLEKFLIISFIIDNLKRLLLCIHKSFAKFFVRKCILHKKWTLLLRIFIWRYGQIRGFLPIWSYLLKRSSMENFILWDVVIFTSVTDIETDLFVKGFVFKSKYLLLVTTRKV